MSLKMDPHLHSDWTLMLTLKFEISLKLGVSELVGNCKREGGQQLLQFLIQCFDFDLILDLESIKDQRESESS